TAPGGAELAHFFRPQPLRGPRYPAMDRGPASVLAAVRRGNREGTLLDATAEPEFIKTLMTKIHAEETVRKDGQKVEFRPTTAFAGVAMPEINTVSAIEREQSNSSVIVDG